MIKEKRAFTLAEVLITLGIIGVVAAITMSILINNKQAKELETGLKKGASVIAQALDMYQAENGERLKPLDFVDWQELRDMFILKYFKVAKDCGRGFINGSCILNMGYGQEGTDGTYTTYNGYTIINLYVFDDGQYVLADGTLLLIEYSIASGYALYISIDVNGYKKRPNRLGQDIFMFQVDANGKLLPMGAEGTYYYSISSAYCSKTSTNKMNGAGCTYKALTEKDYFKNLPK